MALAEAFHLGLEVRKIIRRGGAHMLPSVRRGKLLERLCRAFEVRTVLEIGTLATFCAIAAFLGGSRCQPSWILMVSA